MKNALMSEIITEERYKIYKICDFSKKMAYRQKNEKKTSKMYNGKLESKKAYRRKIHCLACCPSPPL